MPIQCSVPLTNIDQEDFHALDKEVMRQAFAIHNELGRFFDEDIYQAELARRCNQAGLFVQREVMLSAIHKTFRKDYYLDLLFSSGSIYELKCALGLMRRHDGQLINYLLLAGIQHGKLINFRPESVESRFVSTRLTPATRQMFHVKDAEWRVVSDKCVHLNVELRALLEDWGAFLSVELYQDALVHLLGGEDAVVCPVNVRCNEVVAGQKNICLLDSKTAFHLSAMSQRIPGYETHLYRLLSHTELDAMQWINFTQDQIVFKTILNK